MRSPACSSRQGKQGTGWRSPRCQNPWCCPSRTCQRNNSYTHSSHIARLAPLSQLGTLPTYMTRSSRCSRSRPRCRPCCSCRACLRHSLCCTCNRSSNCRYLCPRRQRGWGKRCQYSKRFRSKGFVVINSDGRGADGVVGDGVVMVKVS